MKEKSIVEKVKLEINNQVSNQEVMNSLMSTTFKGLDVGLVKGALLEGMLTGFTFQNFLAKDVYAIPFRGGYSLVTSIDYCRKIAMKNGLAGKSAPKYQMDNDGNILSCEITVKRSVDGIVGEYSALVFFKEFNTGRNLWASKPAMMIAKVAEMHALRQAFPENLAKYYSEDEMEAQIVKAVEQAPTDEEYSIVFQNLSKATNEDELRSSFIELADNFKSDKKVIEFCKELKKNYESTQGHLAEVSGVADATPRESDRDDAEKVDGQD